MVLEGGVVEVEASAEKAGMSDGLKPRMTAPERSALTERALRTKLDMEGSGGENRIGGGGVWAKAEDLLEDILEGVAWVIGDDEVDVSGDAHWCCCC